MAEFQYEIIEEIGVLSESKSGWRKEVNRVSWNGAAPKLDIRDWAPDHEKMGKGITLSTEERHIEETRYGDVFLVDACALMTALVNVFKDIFLVVDGTALADI